MFRRICHVYNLTIDKGGPKLRRSAADAKFKYQFSEPVRHPDRRRADDHGKLAGRIFLYSGRPVFNKIGLDGGFGFTLEFVSPNLAAADSELEGESLFTALRDQLGLNLKLESAMAPFDGVVVDSAERPSAN